MTHTHPDSANKPESPALRAFNDHLRQLLRAVLEDFVVAATRGSPTPASPSALPPEAVLPPTLAGRVLSRRSALIGRCLTEFDEAFLRWRDPARRTRRKGKVGEHHRAATLAERISRYTLLDEDELQIQILVKTAARTLMESAGADLAELNLRLEYILCHTPNAALSPVNPEVLAGCLQEALREAELSSPEQYRVMDAFLQFLGVRYRELIQQCNEGFIRRGVLPEIDAEEAAYHARQLREEEAAIEKRTALLETLSGSTARDGVVAPERFYEGLGALVEQAAGDERLGGHVARHDEACPSMAQADLLALLEQLAAEPEAGDGTLASRIDEQVRQQGLTLEARAASSLSLVSLLFEELASNEALNPRIREVIEGLRWPFARAAVLDDTFFSDADNPAQDLLNSLAKAGATWTPPANGRRDSLFNKLESLVQQVREEFDDDYSVFDQALNDLDLFQHAERRRARLIEERLVATEKARARTTRAKAVAARHVSEQWADLRGGAPGVPAFLDQVWQQALFFIYNKQETTECEDWQNAMALESRLLGLTPDAPEPQRQECAEALQGTLEAVGLGDQLAEDWIRRLLDGRQPAVVAAPSEPAQAGASPVTAAVLPEVHPRVLPAAEIRKDTHVATPEPVGEAGDMADGEDEPTWAPEIVRLVDSIAMGAWLQRHDGDQVEKVRVAAYIRPTDTYVLVSRAGAKVAQPTRAELLSAVAEGRIRVLETGMMFERALESVISNLRRLDTAAS